MVSVRYKGCTDWMKNEDWYGYDAKKQRFFLTDKAPPKARQSFELYKKANGGMYQNLTNEVKNYGVSAP